MKLFRITIQVVLLLILASCEDFLEKEPVDAIAEEEAVTDTRSAEEAIAELYASFYVLPNQSLEALSDQATGLFGFDDEFSLNSVAPESQLLNSIWRAQYQTIVQANIVIDRIAALDIEKREQLVAEAKAIRACHYLTLVQHWGDVPYSESPDYRVLEDLGRIATNEIYTNLVADLEQSQQDLPVSYEDEGTTRTRFTQGGVTALLARTHLYSTNWVEAEAAATAVISHELYALQSDYSNAFIKNSQESILELWSNAELFLGIGNAFLPFGLGGIQILLPTEKMSDAFEPGDVRRDISFSSDALGQMYVSKYPDVNRTGAFQEVKILRLAEMYLIRAEARARQNDLTGAITDINVIRSRAGLPATTADDQASVLLAIEQERFVELAFEGHRWVDLVRTGRANEVMEEFNPQGWEPTDQLMPIPLMEIDLNPNILPQNPGY